MWYNRHDEHAIHDTTVIVASAICCKCHVGSCNLFASAMLAIATLLQLPVWQLQLHRFLIYNTYMLQLPRWQLHFFCKCHFGSCHVFAIAMLAIARKLQLITCYLQHGCSCPAGGCVISQIDILYVVSLVYFRIGVTAVCVCSVDRVVCDVCLLTVMLQVVSEYVGCSCTAAGRVHFRIRLMPTYQCIWAGRVPRLLPYMSCSVRLVSYMVVSCRFVSHIVDP